MMNSIKLEDVVQSFAFVHFRNRKVLHNSNAGLNFVGFRTPTVSQSKNIYILCLFCTCIFQEN